MTTRTVLATAIVFLSLATWMAYPPSGLGEDAAHQHGQHDHAHHMASAQSPQKRTTASYDPPAVVLINQNGDQVDLDKLVASDKIVMLNFIFASCATVCPVLTAGFANFQDKLDAATQQVQLVSVTIDPEHDTPEVLLEYSQRFGADPGWEFLTGSRKDINDVMRALDAFVANKMNHRPLTFFHTPGASEWTRIEGFLSTTDYLGVYTTLAKE